MLELALREVFPEVLYANSNIPVKIVRMMLSKKKILKIIHILIKEIWLIRT